MVTSFMADRASELVAVTLLLALSLSRLDANLFIVFFQGSKIFASLREFTFLHTLTNIPVYERTLRVHQVELMIDPRKHLSDRSRVTDHAYCTHDLRQVASRHDRGRLVVDTALEPCGAPVNELDCTLGLD